VYSEEVEDVSEKPGFEQKDKYTIHRMTLQIVATGIRHAKKEDTKYKQET